MKKKLKILLTGGSGLLALNWAIEIGKEFEVILGLHTRSLSIKGFHFVQVNMESVEGFLADLQKIQPDIVIHCAGLANVEVCEANPVEAFHVNVTLSENVAKGCRQCGVSFVYISTDHLFSGNTPLVSEEEPTSPVNEYGKTKLEGEKRILAVSDKNLSIRTNFYGWGTTYRHSFSDMIIQNIRNGQTIFLFEDFFYTPILISDLAKTVMSLLNNSASGIYNVVGNDRISKYEFGICVANQFQLDTGLIIPTKFSVRKDLVKRPHDLSLSNKKAQTFLKSVIGDIDQNIAQMLRQEKNGVCSAIQNL